MKILYFGHPQGFPQKYPQGLTIAVDAARIKPMLTASTFRRTVGIAAAIIIIR